MTFNELLSVIEKSGNKLLADKLYEYILINFKQADFDKAAQMLTDQIVNWEPRPVFPHDWVMSMDFAYAQNFASLLRARGILPPPIPTEFEVEVLVVGDVDGEVLLTTEFINDRPN